MKHSVLLTAAVAALALPSLSACSSLGGEDPVAMFDDAPAYVAVDPSDSKLHSAIQTYIALNKGPKNSQYQYVREDLNGDGLREGLVLFNLPHSHWCGWSGCTMAIFKADDNAFALLSQTSRIRGPLVVGGTRTNGWEDIGVRLTGTEMHDYNVVLQFDGLSYPENPMAAPALPYDLAELGGTKVFP